MPEIVQDTEHPAVFVSILNDNHLLPATEKQLQFARAIALRTGQVLPWEAQQDRQSLSTWVSEN